MFSRIPQMSFLNTQGQMAVLSSLMGTLINQDEERSEDAAGAWGSLGTTSPPRGNIWGPCWMVVNVAYDRSQHHQQWFLKLDVFSNNIATGISSFYIAIFSDFNLIR